MRNRRFYYHVTHVDRGPTMEVQKRPPISRGKDEPIVPRICVAPAVADCLAAALLPPGSAGWVYRTPRPVRAVRPWNVWDADLTRERWLWYPYQLEFFARIEPEIVNLVQQPIRLYHRRSRLPSDPLVRICALKLAYDHLNDRFPDKRAALVNEVAAKILKGKTLHEYLATRSG